MAAAPTQDRDVIEVIRSQHDEIRALFARLEDAPVAERSDAFRELRPLLAVHETTEAHVVHRALQRSAS